MKKQKKTPFRRMRVFSSIPSVQGFPNLLIGSGGEIEFGPEKKHCKPLEQEENHKNHQKGLRWSWA